MIQFYCVTSEYIRGRLLSPLPPMVVGSLFVVEGGMAVCAVVPAGTRGRKRS